MTRGKRGGRVGERAGERMGAGCVERALGVVRGVRRGRAVVAGGGRKSRVPHLAFALDGRSLL